MLQTTKVTYPVTSSPTARPSRFSAATTSPATTWSTTPTAWTAQVSKVDFQLGRDVIGWLPEVVLIVTRLHKKVEGKVQCFKLYNFCSIIVKYMYKKVNLPWSQRPQGQSAHLSCPGLEKGKKLPLPHQKEQNQDKQDTVKSLTCSA